MTTVYPRVKDLCENKRMHLAWRLDHKTYCGMITASRICRLETNHKDMYLPDLFKLFDMTDHSAKIHSTKVCNFKLIK